MKSKSRSTDRPSPAELEREQAKKKIVEAAFAIGATALIGLLLCVQANARRR